MSNDEPGDRTRVAEPNLDDHSVKTATGLGWDEWCDIIEAWPGHREGHGAIAAYLRDEHGVDSWWAQSVTVGYERISGLRLPYQQPDGTFSVSKSRTVIIDADGLRQSLLDEADRTDLFPGQETELRSGPTAKTLRIALGPGIAQFAMEAAGGTKTKVTVTHERLPSPEAAEHWRIYWSDWLAGLEA